MSGLHACERCNRPAAPAPLAEKPILTPSEAAALLGRSRSWVEAKLASGLLPGVRDGSRWIVRRADLLRDGWLAPERGAAVSGPPPALAAHEREQEAGR